MKKRSPGLKFIFGFLDYENASVELNAIIATMCLIAGVSEKIIPNLVGEIETSIASNRAPFSGSDII